MSVVIPSARLVPQNQNRAIFAASFLGTDLTIGGALGTITVSPVVWLIIDLVWAALPA